MTLIANILAAEGPNNSILAADINEVIWGSIAFFVVTFLIAWKGGPAIKDMWNGRIERISNELDQAATERSEAETHMADIQARVADLDAERTRILDEARATAEAVTAQIAERAESDAAELVERARSDIESSKAQAMADLRREVAVLALGAAEAVVEANLDGATQQQLIERYISNVGTAS